MKIECARAKNDTTPEHKKIRIEDEYEEKMNANHIM